MPGRFITFEGGEGTGKSTQLRLLAEVLKTAGISAVATKEPGGSPIGPEIRSILVTGDKDKMDPIAEAMLYYAERRVHLTHKVWPAMAEGKWVLSDRFADSTTAYQYYGYNKRVPIEILQNLYQMAVGDFKPDLTILLDIEPAKGLQRSFNKADNMSIKELRFESRGLEFHNNLRRGYLEIAAAEPERFVVLNADKPIEELHLDIVNVVNERFNLSLCRK